MDTWFYSKEGRAQGPQSRTEIEALIQGGALQPFDLIFREGEKQWRPANAYKEFEKFWTSKTDLNQEKKWVLLTRNLEDTQSGEPRFLQAGPFSKDQIKQKVEKGDIKWTDHIWTHGFTSWKTLADVSEFNSDVVEPAIAETQSEIPENLLDSVMAQSQRVLFSDGNPQEAQPMEVKGENLAKDFVNFKTPTLHEEKTDPGVEQKPARPRTMFYAGTFVLLALALSVVMLVPPRKTKIEAAATIEKTITDRPSVVATKTESTVPQRAAPMETTLRIVPLKLNSQSPQLAIETNVSANDPIEVTVKAKDGEVLDLVRFSHSVQVARQSTELPIVDLSRWALPQGTYTVDVKANSIRKTQNIFIGEKNSSFLSLLEKHKKQIAQQKIKERKDLSVQITFLQVYSKQLHKRIQLVHKDKKQWLTFYKTWLKSVTQKKSALVKKFKIEKSDHYVYPSVIAGVQMSYEELTILGRALNQKSPRAPAATADFSKLDSGLVDLKKRL